MSEIVLKRVYDEPSPEDGTRILVERLWPRGLSTERAAVDFWSRDTAPSSALRTWFGHDPARWDEFKTRYFAELDARVEAVLMLRAKLDVPRATFLFAARDTRFNNAVALRAYIQRR